jgi:hypothetical protein
MAMADLLALGLAFVALVLACWSFLLGRRVEQRADELAQRLAVLEKKWRG